METLVYIAIVGLLFAAVTDSVLALYRGNRNILEQTDQIDFARKGIVALTMGIREADYSAWGAYPIESAATNTITFYQDYDNDGTVERIRYFLAGKDFARGVIEPSGSPAVYTGPEGTTTISQYAENVAEGSDIFQYYDTTGALMASPYILVNIRYVKVNLIININPATLPNAFSLRSSATIRNVKSNL